MVAGPDVRSPADGSGDTAQPPACVHVDLDGARHIFHLRGWPWTAASDPVYQTGLPRALDLFDELGIRATLFVIADDVEDAAKLELLREAVARGHDIASHSVTHTELRRQTPDERRREVFESRDLIGAALGVVPAGFRAPNFSIDAGVLRLLDEAGYRWDSSTMPDRKVPGLATRFDRPLAVWPDRGLLELPLPSHRPLPLPFHPSYSLVLGVRYFDWGVGRLEATRAPFVLLFHLIDFADPLPRTLVGGWKRKLFTLSHIGGDAKLNACRRILERVRRSYRITDTDGLIEAALGGGSP